MNPITSILFATDLSEKCRPAFELAASMATRYQATIILLHVTEKIPGYVESRLKGLFGEEEFEKIAKNHEQSMQEKLIAKKTSDNFIRTALEQFCIKAGIEDASCDFHSREVVVRNGDVVNEIIRQSKKYECDMIILGGRKGLLKTTSIGAVIKETLRRSKIPVLVVPPGK